MRMSKFVQTVLAPAAAACLVHYFQMCFYPRQSGCCLKPRELYKLQILIGLFSPSLWPRGSRAREPDGQLGEELHPHWLAGKGRSRIQQIKSSLKQDWPLPLSLTFSHTSYPFYRGGSSWSFIRAMFSYYNNNLKRMEGAFRRHEHFLSALTSIS